MFNLLDLMRAAQGGAAMENMARQFGLSLDQTRRSLEALMPAFALGFQRNAADPMGFAILLKMMGSGQYASFFDQPSLAFTPQAGMEGNRILGQLFGADASRQVAEQAAAWAGIGPEIMKQMMPTVATMLMGGLFRSAANQGLAELFEQFAQMLRGGGAPAAPQPRGRSEEPAALPDPFGAWHNMLGTMWAGSASAPAPEPERDAQDQIYNPFAPWAAMMSAMLSSRPDAAVDKPAPAPASPPLQNPFEFFGQMFETGREVQEQHLTTLQGIFDASTGAKAKADRRR